MALRSWDKVEEPGKRPISFTKITQSAGEIYSNFLQILTSAVYRVVADSDTRNVFIESLTFENANTECQRPGGP